MSAGLGVQSVRGVSALYAHGIMPNISDVALAVS